MTLKELLGTAYKEGMTLEEVETALAAQNADTGEVERLRSALTKANSEAADYKKQLRALQTEEEQKKAQEAEDRKQLQEAYDALLKESTTAKHKASFLSLGYEEALAQEAAEALVSGDTEKVFDVQKRHQTALETRLKSENMHSMGDPASGNPAQNSMTLEKLRSMTPSERFEYSQNNPEEYKTLYGGN